MKTWSQMLLTDAQGNTVLIATACSGATGPKIQPTEPESPARLTPVFSPSGPVFSPPRWRRRGKTNQQE